MENNILDGLMRIGRGGIAATTIVVIVVIVVGIIAGVSAAVLLKPKEEAVTQTITISGTVTYADYTGAEILLAAFTSKDFQTSTPIARGEISSPGTYSIQVPVNSGQVWIVAGNDVNGNGKPDPDEPNGETPVVVGAVDIENVNVILMGGGENQPPENQPPSGEYVVKEYLPQDSSGNKNSALLAAHYSYTITCTYDLSWYSLPFRVRLWKDGEGTTYNGTLTTIGDYQYSVWSSATSNAYMTISGTRQAALYDDAHGSFVDENFGWLGSESCHGDLLIDTQNSTIRSIAENILSESSTPYEVAKNAAIWISDYGIKYGKPSGIPSNVNKTPTEVLDTKEGDCIELSTLYASICRAAGVPTKIVWGVRENKTSAFGHVWNEFYDNGNWVPVDMTFLIMDHTGPSAAIIGPVSDWFGYVDARDIPFYIEDANGLEQIYSDSHNFEDGLPPYTRTCSGEAIESAKLEIYNTGRRELVFQ